MATIITVHGTGVTGAEHGEDWWQVGSQFAAEMFSLVEGQDGQIMLRPHVWDGQNSETSRRSAANTLYRKVEELETQGQKYCIVGHSHGGSVTGNVLLLAASRKNTLPNFARWITVGTPFVRSRNAFFLFSRLGHWAKAGYLSFLASGLIIMAELLINSVADWSFRMFIFFVCLLPFSLFYLWLRFASYRSRFAQRKATIRDVATFFNARWLSLTHANDEALSGLRALRNIAIPFFPRNFAVPTLVLASVFLAPVALAFAITSETLILYLFENFPPTVAQKRLITDGKLVGGGKDVVINLEYLFTLLDRVPKVSGLEPVLAAFLGIPLLIFALSSAIIFVSTSLAA